MKFPRKLVEGTLIKRYKRFFVDVKLPTGEVITAHCPNTGSMKGCLIEGAQVRLEPASNPDRKLKWTWIMVKIGRTWIGLDTGKAVPLVEEAIAEGMFPELGGYDRMIREVKYGMEGRSRIDLLLSRGGKPEDKPKNKRRTLFVDDERAYVEVKNTTLQLGKRTAAFPDAVTERGRKHLHELMHVVDQGHRAAMVYCTQRADCDTFVPAYEIDPAYGETLREALKAGVEAFAFTTRATNTCLRPDKRLPIEI